MFSALMNCWRPPRKKRSKSANVAVINEAFLVEFQFVSSQAQTTPPDNIFRLTKFADCTTWQTFVGINRDWIRAEHPTRFGTTRRFDELERSAEVAFSALPAPNDAALVFPSSCVLHIMKMFDFNRIVTESYSYWGAPGAVKCLT